MSVLLGKKYKLVALKVKPVHMELADKFRIIRNITGDPLAEMPELNPNPPKFKPTGRYTPVHQQAFDQVHKGDFLLPEEHKAVHHLMMEQNEAFAWDDTK